VSRRLIPCQQCNGKPCRGFTCYACFETGLVPSDDSAARGPDMDNAGRADLAARIGLVVALGLITLYGAALAIVGTNDASEAQAAAMACAHTTEDFSDSGIARCYTERGLPVPDDL